MLEFINAPDDVIAVKISGRITGEDLDRVMDRVEATMERHARVHVFAETQGLDSIEFSALPHYLSRVFPLFGKLKRFDRVAVVADQAWVRIGTQIESAVLPFISYRTFEPKDRERALTWALTGKEPVEAG